MDHPDDNSFPAAIRRAYDATEEAVRVAAYLRAVAGRKTEQSIQHHVSLYTTIHSAETNRFGGLRIYHGAAETLTFNIDDAALACELMHAINRVLARHAAGAVPMTSSAPVAGKAPEVRAVA